MKQVPIYIEGNWQVSACSSHKDVVNPATQEVLAMVPFATENEVLRAIKSANAVFQEWRNTPAIERARLMMRYVHLLKEHQKEIADIISQELGKTTEDAMAEVWRGIEVVEHAANIPSLLMGETTENVAKSVDTYSVKQALGVCIGVTPFNFPAMIPLWMFPLAVACGNSLILKPSEQVPLTPTRLVELFEQAGAPKGLIQLIHGGKEQVDILLQANEVKAVSFVGSASAGQQIYQTGCNNLKRVQAFLGAKNHMVIMPDANKEQVVTNLVGASVGAAGQRCMAISVAIFVGKANLWLKDVQDKLTTICPGHYSDPDSAYGPLISAEAKDRIEGLISRAKKQGAKCLLDGTNCHVAGFPKGNWLGPTLFKNVNTAMEIYQQEVFGPVLLAIEVESFEQAVNLVNNNPYGNGTSIFTSSGFIARQYQNQVTVGQIGINIPIPVPPPYFSFTGWKGSFAGDMHAYGKQAVHFYTETKTITARWFKPCEPSADAEPNMTIRLN